MSLQIFSWSRLSTLNDTHLMKTNEVSYQSSLCMYKFVCCLCQCIFLGDVFFDLKCESQWLSSEWIKQPLEKQFSFCRFYVSPSCFRLWQQTPQRFSHVYFYEKDKGKKMCEPYMENGKFTENSLLLRGSVRARPVCLCVCHGKVFNKSNTKPIKMLCRSEWCIHLLRIYTLYTMLYAVFSTLATIFDWFRAFLYSASVSR